MSTLSVRVLPSFSAKPTSKPSAPTRAGSDLVKAIRGTR